MASSSDGWLIDCRQLYALADSLSVDSSEMRKAFHRGIMRAGSIVKKQAASNLRAVDYNGNLISNADFLANAILLKVWRSNRGALIALLDNRKVKIRFKGNTYRNPSFILRFINAGTAERYTRTGGRFRVPAGRGRMVQKPFFSTAVQQKLAEAQNSIEANITEAIRRIASKRQKP